MKTLQKIGLAITALTAAFALFKRKKQAPETGQDTDRMT
jgi:hypothetical protein